jgi:hypothetical protein
MLPLDENKKIIASLAPDDKEVLFADRILFLSDKLNFDQYQLIIAPKYIHFFKSKLGENKGSFSPCDIDKIEMSH